MINCVQIQQWSRIKPGIFQSAMFILITIWDKDGKPTRFSDDIHSQALLAGRSLGLPLLQEILLISVQIKPMLEKLNLPTLGKKEAPALEKIMDVFKAGGLKFERRSSTSLETIFWEAVAKKQSDEAILSAGPQNFQDRVRAFGATAAAMPVDVPNEKDESASMTMHVDSMRSRSSSLSSALDIEHGHAVVKTLEDPNPQQFELLKRFELLSEEIRKRSDKIVLKPDDVELCDAEGNTLLHIAAECGNKVFIRQVLGDKEKRFERFKEIRNARGFAPLHSAVLHGHKNTVCVLLDYFDIGLVDTLGNTIAHFAAQVGNAEVMEIVRNENLNLLLKPNSLGEKPIHIAIVQGHIEIVKMLTKHSKTFYEEKNAKNETPLHLVAANTDGHDSELLMFLLKEMPAEYPFDQMRDINGRTPIHVASSKGNDVFLSLFFKKYRNAPIRNFVDRMGNSALHDAVIAGHKRCVEILLANGADPFISNSEGKSVYRLIGDESGNSKVDLKELLKGHRITSAVGEISEGLVFQIYKDEKKAVKPDTKMRDAIKKLVREALGSCHKFNQALDRLYDGDSFQAFVSNVSKELGSKLKAVSREEPYWSGSNLPKEKIEAAIISVVKQVVKQRQEPQPEIEVASTNDIENKTNHFKSVFSNQLSSAYSVAKDVMDGKSVVSKGQIDVGEAVGRADEAAGAIAAVGHIAGAVIPDAQNVAPAVTSGLQAAVSTGVRLFVAWMNKSDKERKQEVAGRVFDALNVRKNEFDLFRREDIDNVANNFSSRFLELLSKSETSIDVVGRLAAHIAERVLQYLGEKGTDRAEVTLGERMKRKVEGGYHPVVYTELEERCLAALFKADRKNIPQAKVAFKGKTIDIADFVMLSQLKVVQPDGSYTVYTTDDAREEYGLCEATKPEADARGFKFLKQVGLVRPNGDEHVLSSQPKVTESSDALQPKVSVVVTYRPYVVVTYWHEANAWFPSTIVTLELVHDGISQELKPKSFSGYSLKERVVLYSLQLKPMLDELKGCAVKELFDRVKAVLTAGGLKIKPCSTKSDYDLLYEAIKHKLTAERTLELTEERTLAALEVDLSATRSRDSVSTNRNSFLVGSGSRDVRCAELKNSSPTK